LAYLINQSGNMTKKDIMKAVNKIDPNMSVCPECGVDDFTHVEGCRYIKLIEEEG